MYNSFEILIFGSSISNIQKQYSILSEKVKITMVKIHRSKREYFNWFKRFIKFVPENQSEEKKTKI